MRKSGGERVIVVTGAPGHIGNNLVRLLLSKGESVRAMVLPGEDLTSLKGLAVEIVEGDVRNPSALDRAFHGADLVFHLASVISLSPGKSELLHQVNVVGARNVAEACLRNKVKRLVYASSIHALVEPPKGTCIYETAECNPNKISMEYSKTKAEGTLAVLEVVEQGLDAVVVYPVGVIGPFDFKPSEVGQMIIHFAKGRLPVAIEGGYDFADVRDIASGFLLAAERGRTGQGYILSGEWVSVNDILAAAGEIVGRTAPKIQISAQFALLVARTLTWWQRLTGMKPIVTTDMIETLLSNSEVSCVKAQQELGYVARPIRDSVRDSAMWFRENGKL